MDDQPDTEGVEKSAVINEGAHPGKFCEVCGAEALPKACNNGPCPHVAAIEQANAPAEHA